MSGVTPDMLARAREMNGQPDADVSALTLARRHARQMHDSAAAIDTALVWAAVAQAEELAAVRREVRGLTDALLRAIRALTEEVDT